MDTDDEVTFVERLIEFARRVWTPQGVLFFAAVAAALTWIGAQIFSP